MDAVNVALALESLIRLNMQALQISQLIKTARAEGRDITADELKTLQDQDDAARVEFDQAIAAARARQQG